MSDGWINVAVYVAIFFGVAIGFWMGGKSKAAVVFMVLYLIGFYGFQRLHCSEQAFRVYVVVVGAGLLLIDRYKPVIR